MSTAAELLLLTVEQYRQLLDREDVRQEVHGECGKAGLRSDCLWNRRPRSSADVRLSAKRL